MLRQKITREYVRWACVCAGAAADLLLKSCCDRKPSERGQTLHHSWDAPSDYAHPRHLKPEERNVCVCVFLKEQVKSFQSHMCGSFFSSLE